MIVEQTDINYINLFKYKDHIGSVSFHILLLLSYFTNTLILLLCSCPVTYRY